MGELLQKRVLITVKTYPNPSKKYGETVCCAGIDMDTGQWIRLYPIPYRDLDTSQKFKKYTIIGVKCWKAPADRRMESYKVDSDSIEQLEWLDTSNNWAARGKIVLPSLSDSFCGILKDGGKERSLGVFKPVDTGFSEEKAALESEARRRACYSQLSFFDRSKNAIEQIPLTFYYHFKCAGERGCPGHKLPITDWEIGQSYRDWRHKYPAKDLLMEKIRQRWLDMMCSDRNDVYFYVGNMHRFPKHFMVLGVFYPRKQA